MKKYFATAFVFVSVAIGIASYAPFAHATNSAPIVTGPLSGWLWADNIGWISVNCATGGPTATNSNVNICSTVNYSVVSDAYGILNGYAWSDAIGWIKFGNLYGFPSGSGTTNVNAEIDQNGIFYGWARACAGTVNASSPSLPGDCSSMTSRTDGWDGWISLGGQVVSAAPPQAKGASSFSFASVLDGLRDLAKSGGGATTSTPYSFSYSYLSNSYPGWAWGSDVVGWVKSSFNTSGPDLFKQCSASVQPCTHPPVVTLSVTPSTIPADGNATAQINWTATNVTRCMSNWTGGGVLGPFNTPPITSTTTNTYTINCVPSDGTSPNPTSASANLTITPYNLAPPPPAGGTCSVTVSNATQCNGSTGSSSRIVGSSQSLCSSPANTSICEWYCSSGFHQRVGTLQCVRDSTLNEK